MNAITKILIQLHAALAASKDHLAVVYQVQGNFADGTGERVFHACINRAAANVKCTELKLAHPGKSFRVVVTVAE